MTDNIVSIGDHRPHNRGPARCLDCRQEWEAVAPVGVVRLECPSCGTMRGHWMGIVLPQAGTAVFTCFCGSDLFVLQPEKITCAGCGTEATAYR